MLFAFLAAAPTETLPAQASSGPLHCEIQRTDKGDMVEFTGIAGSTRPIVGESSFVVTKSGPSGSSNMNQGQHFSVKADQQTVVGRATMNVDSGGHIAVDLRLQTDDGIECRAQASFER